LETWLRGSRISLLDPKNFANGPHSYLAAASLVDLGSLENSPDGEDLLSALWDIAFGDPLDVKSKCHLEKWLEKG
jgi:hypothetical protein